MQLKGIHKNFAMSLIQQKLRKESKRVDSLFLLMKVFVLQCLCRHCENIFIMTTNTLKNNLKSLFIFFFSLITAFLIILQP